VSMSAIGSVCTVAPSYQELLVIPGMTPSWASSRKQMRQSLNLRKTARGRPQRWQREYRRVLKRCDLCCLTT